MDDIDESDLPEIPSRSELIGMLSGMREDHRRIYDRAVVRVHPELHVIDHFVAIAMRRSVAMTRGFLLLFDDGNEFAAMPLIRLQLDSLLRVSALTVVDDPFALAKYMLNGKELPKYDKKKYDLSDAALRKRLEGKYDDIDRLYKETSGYVHLSNHHLIRMVDDWHNPDRREDDTIRFGELDELPAWREEDKKSALFLFCVATRYLLDEAAEIQSAQRSP
jgi:hypothetical protein